MPTYTGISSEAFRHPLDQQAEQALRSFTRFDLIASKFVEFVYERPSSSISWATAFKLDRASIPASDFFENASEILTFPRASAVRIPKSAS